MSKPNFTHLNSDYFFLHVRLYIESAFEKGRILLVHVLTHINHKNL